MKSFFYVARDSAGDKVTGTLEAADKQAAVAKLKQWGRFPISLEETEESNRPVTAASARSSEEPMSMTQQRSVSRGKVEGETIRPTECPQSTETAAIQVKREGRAVFLLIGASLQLLTVLVNLVISLCGVLGGFSAGDVPAFIYFLCSGILGLRLYCKGKGRKAVFWINGFFIVIALGGLLVNFFESSRDQGAIIFWILVAASLPVMCYVGALGVFPVKSNEAENPKQPVGLASPKKPEKLTSATQQSGGPSPVDFLHPFGTIPRRPLLVTIAAIATGVLLVAAVAYFATRTRELKADVACEEKVLGSGIYTATALTDNVEMATLELGGSTSISPKDLMNTRVKYKPCIGKNVVFKGNMSCLIGLRDENNPRSRIITAAALAYDPNNNENPPLAELGVIPINKSGIVKSSNAKSGWINWAAWLKFDDAGRRRSVLLQDVCFWVNRGGENWLSFSIARAREQTRDGGFASDVPVTVSIDRKGANGVVTICVEGTHAFHPVIKDEQTLDFVTVASVFSKTSNATMLPVSTVTLTNENFTVDYPSSWGTRSLNDGGATIVFEVPNSGPHKMLLSDVVITKNSNIYTTVETKQGKQMRMPMGLNHWVSAVMSSLQLEQLKQNLGALSIESDKPIRVDGHPGRQFVLRSTDSSQVVRVFYTFVVSDPLTQEATAYTISYKRLEGNHEEEKPIIDRMVNSLRLRKFYLRPLI
jgi:hypothetical protein